jgi:cytochrome c biogenesis protein CcdA/thiol-disulfide isomerase/thioredoxin
VLELVVIGFLGGVVAGISPCILPVLPVVLAAGVTEPTESTESTESHNGEPLVDLPAPALVREPVAAGAATAPSAAAAGVAAGGDPAGSGDPSASSAGTVSDRSSERWGRRRALAVVAGLALSFGLFTLIGTWLLDALHLPLDTLRWLGIAVVGIVGAGLLVPALGVLLERPFARLGVGRPRPDRGGFLLGASLGLVFVPCAGPVLAAISAVGAERRFGFSAIVLTAAFAAGVAVPLAVFALAGRSLLVRVGAVRRHAGTVRRVAGAVLVVTALALAFNLTDGVQRSVPGYTDSLQNRIETGAAAKRALAGVTGASTSGQIATCPTDSPALEECGKAPALAGISRWLNTSGGRPLSLAGLRGKVVLVDFWTYSCINCQRTLPHLEAWYRAYARDGFVVIGVHTPEFAFEHVVSNVSTAARQLGVGYPIAIDNQYGTWNAYENSYWPAEYLIDSTGTVRHIDTGEGSYAQSETFIRQLLAQADPRVQLPRPTEVPDLTPTEETTPESYLGYQRAQFVSGETVEEDQMTAYQPPDSVPQDMYAYAGNWSVGSESASSGRGAQLLLQFAAKDVYLVVGGTGTIGVSVNGQHTRTVVVSGEPRLYQLVGPGAYQQALLTLTVSPGVAAYDFTFG